MEFAWVGRRNQAWSGTDVLLAASSSVMRGEKIDGRVKIAVRKKKWSFPLLRRSGFTSVLFVAAGEYPSLLISSCIDISAKRSRFCFFEVQRYDIYSFPFPVHSF